MTRTSWLALGATAISLARTARAQPGPLRPTARLLWQSDEREPACPDAAWLRRALAARLGYDPFDDRSANTVAVAVSGSGARRVVRLVARDGRGRAVGERTFAGRTAACDELVTSASLTLQLLFDPGGELARELAPLLAALPPLAPPPPAPPPSPPDVPRPPHPSTPPAEVAVRGVEFALRLGYGAFTDDGPSAWIATTSADPFAGLGGGPGFDLVAGVRVLPQLSVGLHGGYQPLRPPAGADRAWAWTVGVYARLYPRLALRRGHVDPWFGAGFDFVARLDVVGPSSDPTSTWTLKALAVPVALGLDVYIAQGLAVGAWGGVTVWLPDEACVDPLALCLVEARSSFGLPVRYEANAAWQFGVEGRYTVPW